jgi:hypothetical protein
MSTTSTVRNWAAVGPELASALAVEHPFFTSMCENLISMCAAVEKVISQYEQQIHPVGQ